MSPEEWLQGEVARSAYNKMDKDHDGKLSRDEWILKYGDSLLWAVPP